MERDVFKTLLDAGFADDKVGISRILNMRYDGSDTALMISNEGSGDYEKEFKRAYKEEFGFLLNKNIVVDDVKVNNVILFFLRSLTDRQSRCAELVKRLTPWGHHLLKKSEILSSALLTPSTQTVIKIATFGMVNQAKGRRFLFSRSSRYQLGTR